MLRQVAAQILNVHILLVQPLVALIIGILILLVPLFLSFFRGDLSDFDRRGGPLAAPDHSLAHFELSGSVPKGASASRPFFNGDEPCRSENRYSRLSSITSLNSKGRLSARLTRPSAKSWRNCLCGNAHDVGHYPMNRNLRAESETRSTAANVTLFDLCMVTARALAPYFFAGAVAVLVRVPAAHADATSAETFVQQSVDKEFAILKDTSLAQQERETRSRALLRSIIDIKRVAMFALGPYARAASDKQIDDFVSAFSDYFLNMFHSELDQSSGGGTIAVTGATARAADDVIVTASVAGAAMRSPTGVPMTLGFRVRKNAAGNDTIVDVLVGAISLAVTQRDEFSSYLQQHGGNIDQLSAELEKRAAAK